ncbi:hypothetical protein FGO68_gene15644 [Halteria grandinella]|uniref:Uncharacterized protein n=1 Tax=Halteria grandinella TaxID=5974 RepID=A0A8J8TAI7_HALGN|nr:hypothetical protein FGO68_gene15644 [Halteria grandinella]
MIAVFKRFNGNLSLIWRYSATLYLLFLINQSSFVGGSRKHLILLKDSPLQAAKSYYSGGRTSQDRRSSLWCQPFAAYYLIPNYKCYDGGYVDLFIGISREYGFPPIYHYGRKTSIYLILQLKKHLQGSIGQLALAQNWQTRTFDKHLRVLQS